MLNRAHYSHPEIPFSRILWCKPTSTHCVRASWHPSTKTQCFAIFAKTYLGILQENTNVFPLLSWHPSKPTNIHAGFITASARKNTPFHPSSIPKTAILHQNPHVLPFLSWHPSKPRNSHACLLTAKMPKNTVFSPAQTTTWHPSKKSQCFATFYKTDLGFLQHLLKLSQLVNHNTLTSTNIQRPSLTTNPISRPACWPLPTSTPATAPQETTSKIVKIAAGASRIRQPLCTSANGCHASLYAVDEAVLL
ncbi:MAG: hypothetical protein HKL96_02410 [Phycisphaerales bacterium]|nr:hypothetical protein [Phycisphaerales bacterium]